MAAELASMLVRSPLLTAKSSAVGPLIHRAGVWRRSLRASRIATTFWPGADERTRSEKTGFFDLWIQTCTRGIGSAAVAQQVVPFGPAPTTGTNQGMITVNVANSIAEGTIKRGIHKRHTQPAAQHTPEKLWIDLGVRVFCGRFDETRASSFLLLKAEVSAAARVGIRRQGGEGCGVDGL